MNTSHNRDGSVSRRAPAKINLGLHVLRRRGDGFHDIETVMAPIGWYDTLTYRREPETFRFTCSDSTLPTDERNLCVRAARALAEAWGIKPFGHLHLDKRIPYGAGLGSGSSDGAATLRLLIDAWDVELDADAVVALAAALGSDVPFFLHERPMLARGRGELLQSVLGIGPPRNLVVVMPDVKVSTAEAYALVQPTEVNRPDLRAVVESGDLARWRRELTNDFQAPIMREHAEIHQAYAHLVGCGADYAALTGTGAAVFGVFEDGSMARRAASSATDTASAVWIGETFSGGSSRRR